MIVVALMVSISEAKSTEGTSTTTPAVAPSTAAACILGSMTYSRKLPFSS